MRIVNKETFLKLPSNTLYCKYTSLGIFGELYIKLGSLSNDWYYSEITGWPQGCDTSDDFYSKMGLAEGGEEFSFDMEVGSRDGMYEEEEYFAVFDKEDVKALINKLSSLL